MSPQGCLIAARGGFGPSDGKTDLENQGKGPASAIEEVPRQEKTVAVPNLQDFPFAFRVRLWFNRKVNSPLHGVEARRLWVGPTEGPAMQPSAVPLYLRWNA